MRKVNNNNNKEQIQVEVLNICCCSYCVNSSPFLCFPQHPGFFLNFLSFIMGQYLESWDQVPWKACSSFYTSITLLFRRTLGHRLPLISCHFYISLHKHDRFDNCRYYRTRTLQHRIKL